MSDSCADSSTEELPLFQVGDGGSTPTSAHQFRIRECKFSDIRRIFEAYHYKGGHMGGGIYKCLSCDFGGRPWGGIVIGPPRHSGPYSNKGQLRVLEIRRMAMLDDAPKNSESWFLSKAVWWLRKHKCCDRVLSYADATVGHSGTIYRAANFRLLGHTAPTTHVIWNGVRYHPRSLTIDREYSYRLREAVQAGTATVIKGKPKSIWIYDIKQ